MSKTVIYYHDPVEVDNRTSWTGLCNTLDNATLVDIRTCTEPKVIPLFTYARPDAVISIDGEPVVSIEQTQMNPSGHNIPQRFSFHVRAAELGVSSILYYPEYSRRRFSDPNVRYVQIRVPLSQQRLSEISGVPALSVFWPTDPSSLLPATGQHVHKHMAEVVNCLIENAGSNNILNFSTIKSVFAEMDRVIDERSGNYGTNPSVRSILPDGFSSSRTKQGIAIDPPKTVHIQQTIDFIKSIEPHLKSSSWKAIRDRLIQREHTFVFTGTANKSRTDSEHPWPGYLTLLDVLYLRDPDGFSPTHRSMNLVYQLPVRVNRYIPRLRAVPQPTATHIVDIFADLIILDGGIIAGRPTRGRSPAATL